MGWSPTLRAPTAVLDCWREKPRHVRECLQPFSREWHSQAAHVWPITLSVEVVRTLKQNKIKRKVGNWASKKAQPIPEWAASPLNSGWLHAVTCNCLTRGGMFPSQIPKTERKMGKEVFADTVCYAVTRAQKSKGNLCCTCLLFVRVSIYVCYKCVAFYLRMVWC